MRTAVVNATTADLQKDMRASTYVPLPPEPLRVQMLEQMEKISEAFYAKAVRANLHQFVAFHGLMQEFIKILWAMHKDGVDFMCALQAKPHHLEYIAEKLDCIFGRALTDPENRSAFLCALADKGGWDLEATLQDCLHSSDGAGDPSDGVGDVDGGVDDDEQ